MKMYRLTLDKDVKDMGHIELSHNMTFGQDGEIWYHDFTNEISLRNFIRELGEKFNIEIPKDDCSFDDEMFYRLAEADSGTIEGILALLNFVFIGYNGLRARLKCYEDLEEQDRLIELPCAVGDTVYEVQKIRKRIQEYTVTYVNYDNHSLYYGWRVKDEKGIYSNLNGFHEFAIGKTVFLNREAAEAKLAEMEGAE